MRKKVWQKIIINSWHESCKSQANLHELYLNKELKWLQYSSLNGVRTLLNLLVLAKVLKFIRTQLLKIIINMLQKR